MGALINDVLGKLESAGRDTADYQDSAVRRHRRAGRGPQRPPICASWWKG